MTETWAEKMHEMSREELEKMLAFAIGMLSTFPPHDKEHPECIFWYLLEAVNKDSEVGGMK